jgi:hypothetical protein
MPQKSRHGTPGVPDKLGGVEDFEYHYRNNHSGGLKSKGPKDAADAPGPVSGLGK